MSKAINEQRPLLRLERFNGVELFAITDARYNIYVDKGSVFGVFRLEAPEAVQTLEDTKILNGSPFWELVWRVPSATPSTLTPGTVIEIPSGYDTEREENITSFYYVTHEASEDNQFVIIQISNRPAQ